MADNQPHALEMDTEAQHSTRPGGEPAREGAVRQRLCPATLSAVLRIDLNPLALILTWLAVIIAFVLGLAAGVAVRGVQVFAGTYRSANFKSMQ
ncbi:hypothetical protein WJX81_005221 [Elliptochloris bilobata]|uniref:Uncharacterized protein n=1 Tax=Elliptochloris bilobata TaxID=381761 RepID=A0AAW1RLE8_9CHLO